MNRVEAVPCDSVVHVNNGLPLCLSDRSGNGIIEQSNAFLRLKFNDMISQRCKGIVELDASNLMAMDENEIIVVNARRKQLLQVDDVDLQQVSPHRIIDLSIEGDRWEGDVLNDEPFGWGVLYDRNNSRVYEGFRIGNVNVCYGYLYYSGMSQIEYEGEWCDGMRWGRGVQYDRYGSIVYDGEWLGDEHLEIATVIKVSDDSIHNHVEELTISNCCCSEQEWRVVDFSVLPSLKSLVIRGQCFMHAEELRLVGLSELRSVEIGERCFTKKSGVFCLKKCARVETLCIGDDSFVRFRVCAIEEVPSLRRICVGSKEFDHFCNCFFYASLELRGVSSCLR